MKPRSEAEEKQWRMRGAMEGEGKAFKPTIQPDVLEAGHSKTARYSVDCSDGAKLLSNIPTWM